MASKKTAMENLIQELTQDSDCMYIEGLRAGKKKDLGLINHYALHYLIPNKWFDWVNRVDASIMIIGQDWGPYTALKRYTQDYAVKKSLKDFSYDTFLFETFSSRTEKFIVQAVEKTYEVKYKNKPSLQVWNNFFFTMAVLFTRQGTHFRGSDNFDAYKSADISFKYVAKQIDIVKPKIIIPLGNLAFGVVNKYFGLNEAENKISLITQKLKPKGYIKAGNTIILPNYHPAAHIDPKIQLAIWEKLWDLL